MNVLQAVEELKKLKDKTKVLDWATDKLKEDQKKYDTGFSYEIQLLTEISDEYHQKCERLEHQLETTPLVTTRCVDVE